MVAPTNDWGLVCMRRPLCNCIYPGSGFSWFLFFIKAGIARGSEQYRIEVHLSIPKLNNQTFKTNPLSTQVSIHEEATQSQVSAESSDPALQPLPRS